MRYYPLKGEVYYSDYMQVKGSAFLKGEDWMDGDLMLNCGKSLDDVKKAIQANNPLAPLHNPPNLTGINVAEDLFPGKPQVAVFDTNFHQTILDIFFFAKEVISILSIFYFLNIELYNFE